ncbi:Dabb family protein [Sphingomonas ginsenosidivorax]|uniref:Dabb family protein n=1 Tax=Sphingomonas ginsenosidivorax TaxID=862135 RepID=A0A5C6U8K5_9SPHN|nr:Dabb family protein [Sphingomonas ginsenosidivorax]TXC67975.1 Dabb family protein [Sphingomonas ginsenosidivorax]
MPVKHIVMWDVRGDSTAERERVAHLVKAKFEALRGEIPGLLLLEIGIDTSRIEYACDVVLYSVFNSQEALCAYATHPAHVRVRDELGDLRIRRHQVDYPTLDEVAA